MANSECIIDCSKSLTPNILLVLLFSFIIVFSLDAENYSILVSEPEKVYDASATNFQGTFYACDAVSATLKKDATNMYLFRSSWHTTFKYWGPIDNIEQNVIAKHNKDMFKIPLYIKLTAKYLPGAKNYANLYLKNIYDLGNGKLLGFMHLEYLTDIQENHPNDFLPGKPSCPDCPYYPATYRIGLSYSRNWGNSWIYCGDILGVNDPSPGIASNIGGAAYIEAGEYFYIYYNEKGPLSGPYPSVARALKKDVLKKAQRAFPTAAKWFKYKYNGISGKWDQKGISGLGSPININPHVDMHSDAAYCSPLKQFLLLGYDEAKKAMLLYRSTNGIDWIDPKFIASESIGSNGLVYKPAYPYFVALEKDSNADCSKVGESFYIYFINQHFEPKIPTDQPKFRVLVKIKSKS